MVEVNQVLYPEQLDSALNFPSVTEVTSSSGEEINRNRDAILAIERTLGVDPHIGRFTVDPTMATVNERLDIIENGIAEGRFAFRNLNVNSVLNVVTDQSGLSQVDIGSDLVGTRVAPVFIRGPLRIEDSGLSNNEVEIKVPFKSSARANVIEAGSIAGESLLRITDFNANPDFTDRLALKIEGNVEITNGKLIADFAVDHSQLLGIDTIPRSGVNALHVTRGDHHSHKRKRDPATGALLNEVDPNPVEETSGLIDHQDLLNIFTKTGQSDFVPVEGVAYHVTGGDDHDHKDGRGASIDHNFLLNVDPAISNHVTGGDGHSHSPAGDGAPIDHSNLLNIGFLSHADIDRILNIELRNHLELIDPEDASNIDAANAGLGHHVPQGHVSNPSAHHARYTDEEALNAIVLISPDTTVYQEGREATVRAHIQAIGSGTVSSNNPHGIAAADIGALEGFDPQGNLPDFTRQFLEQAVEDILNDPTFDVLRGSEDELVSGLWTFDNSGGIIIQDGPGGSTATFNFDRASKVDASIDDVIAHTNNVGGTGTVIFPPEAGVPATSPPFHHAADISYDPSSSTTPLVATDVLAAINEIDAGKEPTLAAGINEVQTSEIADLAVTTAKLDDLGVTTLKIADGSVTLVKIVNQFTVNSYTFAGQVGTAQGTRNFGFLISNVFPSGTIGNVVSVSAMIHRIAAGVATTIDVDVELNGSTVLASSPTDISAFTEDIPGIVAISGTSTVEAGDAFLITLGHTGAGEFEVSVTVDVKLQHIT
jgi:hypothetical protein